MREGDQTEEQKVILFSFVSVFLFCLFCLFLFLIVVIVNLVEFFLTTFA